MRNIDYFKNKNITIVGLARSGLACANLLCVLGAKVSITDNRDNAATRLNASRLKSKEIKVELGEHTPEFIRRRDLVVVSPGVCDQALPVLWASQDNIPLVSEIEVAAMVCPGTIIAITGTSGKTTVTTLIAMVLQASGRHVFTCGNIGNPFSQEVEKIREQDFVSLEVSSFQLQRIETFKPRVAVILNFGRNHLDRHADIEEYLCSKKRIFKNQDENDYLVLNRDDPLIKDLASQAKAKAVYFGKSAGLNPNQAASLAVASVFGIDREIAMRVFRDFKGIEHRLEYVARIKDVTFVNDSKATTVDSAVWALESVTSGKVILIAGGRDKGNDYGAIAPLLRQKAKEAILIGESKGKLRTALKGLLPVHEANSLEEAVRLAFSKAASGDSVLLSPMCSSFDMFSNYEERGRIFKKAVRELQAASDGS